MLRHSKTPIDGQPIENTFVLIDDKTGEQTGLCVLYCDDNPTLYPLRSFYIRLGLEGNALSYTLLGAALGRATEICAQTGKYCRIYTVCEPEDEKLLNNLALIGFQNDDALVSMYQPLPATAEFRVPQDCMIIRDELEEPSEQRNFLDRYNRLYNANNDMFWLKEFINREDFKRILLLGNEGMHGEIITWRENDVGVIGFLQTAPRWRHKGIASALIGIACADMEKQRLTGVEVNYISRIPYVEPLMKKMGFTGNGVRMLYPGINIDPLKK